MFNSRWKKDFLADSATGIAVDIALSIGAGANLNAISEINVRNIADQRLSELLTIAKDIVVRSVSSETIFNMVKASMINISEVVAKTLDLNQSQPDEDLVCIRNPNRVQTKGRPKTGSKRYKSTIEKRAKSKKAKK
ncbi:hypothetical protein BVRB_040120 [Beta vulgaris subsp. vulgaris]|uniref:Uncharacterized protein n=1 Tax=Beta vulgaris subsp. vulgaris TaxID=3555 RepID=A0A0J7YPH1_BETVV|nr:hypothetical protein BVRB_040120 [Beta vulgaris subsp. vulgaris]